MNASHKDLLWICLCFVVGSVFSVAGATTVNPPKPQLANLPLVFEPVAEADGRFVARSQGYAIQLSKQGAQMWLQKDPSQRGKFEQVTLRFLDSQSVTPAPQQIMPGVSNYYLGRKGPQWRQGVPTYGQVKYGELYPGVAAVFYGAGRELEYDFQVAPGADPALIKLEFQGAKSVVLDNKGALHLALNKGEMVSLITRFAIASGIAPSRP